MESAKIEKSPRLQVFLARAGIASRRSSELLIAEGRVSVNGEIVRVPGTKVLPDDRVSLDGRELTMETRLRYLALNKPPGYMCTSRDPENRPLALDLLPSGMRERLYSVGRLDYLSSGLIIFTNDGDFAARLSHPGAGIEKEYFVETSGPIPDVLCEAFSTGITVEGVDYRAIGIERKGRKSVSIRLVEGKNREIRRVFSHFHLHPVLLRRIRIGIVPLGNLEEGKSRPLSGAELTGLDGAAENNAKRGIRRLDNRNLDKRSGSW
ncbi:MAG: rRNA pseudouridine synthase [Treponema sp.]|jgi:23S rRNA pseudouridine2605 synthase|nr:rRNA pseudouridine synthase [Treponema sp.]